MAGKLMRLNELRSRYFAAVGYLQPSQEHTNKNPFSRILDNSIGEQMDREISAAAFEGNLFFQGAPITDTKSNGTFSENIRSLAPIVDIPQSYFAVPRGIFSNEIMSYSDAQEGTTWHKTLHPSPRHPDYDEVLVKADNVDVFLGALKHFACDLPGPSAPLPDQKQFTLCEAITFLAFGHCIDRDKVAEYLDPTWAERAEAALLTIRERATSNDFLHFPETLPSEALDIVLLLYDGKVPKPWPPSAEKLYRLAGEQAERQKANGISLETASAGIYYAFKKGLVVARGNRNGQVDKGEIPLENFRPLLNINWLYDTLAPDDLFGEERFEWSNVTVDFGSLDQWKKAVLGQGSRKPLDKQSNWEASPKPISESELQISFDTYSKTPGANLTRDGIEAWGTNRFGERVTIPRLRSLYKAVAPLGGHPRGRKRKNNP